MSATQAKRAPQHGPSDHATTSRWIPIALALATIAICAGLVAVVPWLPRAQLAPGLTGAAGG